MSFATACARPSTTVRSPGPELVPSVCGLLLRATCLVSRLTCGGGGHQEQAVGERWRTVGGWVNGWVAHASV
jgi:hypothetical protein